MIDFDTKRRKPKVLRWLVPLLFSGLAFWLVLRNADLPTLANNLRQISWKSFVLATVIYFASFVFRALCWIFLLYRKVAFRDVFFTMGAGYLLNNIFPFRLGEIGRAVLLDEPGRISFFEVLSSVFIERLFDVFLATVFILSVLPKVVGSNFDQRVILFVFVFSTLILAGLLLLVKNQEKLENWLLRERKNNHFVKTWLAPKVINILDGLSTLASPRIFFLSFTSLALSWGLAFVQNWIIFGDLFLRPPFWWMVFVLSTGAFGAALPSAPAGLGVFEGAMVAAFSLLGVNTETALTHAVVTHLMTFVYASLIGLIGLRLRGEVIIGFFQRVLNRDPKRMMTD